MQRIVACALLGITAIAPTQTDARGMGRFLGSLVARGAISGAAHSTGAPYATQSKTYTPDVLTVDQLVTCLKRANVLDHESEQLEAKRTEVVWGSRDLDNLANRIESMRSTINRREQFQIDRFNAQIDAYNGKVGQYKTRTTCELERPGMSMVCFHWEIPNG